jgi:8-oxo-dGTP diphosphatase
MDCFLAEVRKGELTLKEAEAARWLTKDQLYDVQWLPADLSLIALLEEEMA